MCWGKYEGTFFLSWNKFGADVYPGGAIFGQVFLGGASLGIQRIILAQGRFRRSQVGCGSTQRAPSESIGIRVSEGREECIQNAVIVMTFDVQFSRKKGNT